jgi:nucleoside-diphosphate-sugar epimerase
MRSARQGSVVVTGASGFIGKALVPRLTPNWEVFAASRAGIIVADAKAVVLDLLDPSTFDNLPRQVDAVVHLAASIEAPDYGSYVATNVLGTHRMLEYAAGAGARVIVYGSTGGIYGSSPHVLTDDSPYAPQEEYGLSKAQADLIVDSFIGDISRVTLRYCAPYAVGTPNPISRIIGNVIAEEELTVSAGMYPRYNPLHLDDAVEMTVRALDLDGFYRLIISGKEITTFAGIALIAGRAIQRVPRFRLIELSEAIPYYRSDTIMDGMRAYELLSYEPRISLDKGISDMARRMAGIS